MKLTGSIAYSSLLVLFITACGTNSVNNNDLNDSKIQDTVKFESQNSKTVQENKKDVLKIVASGAKNIKFTVSGGEDKDKFVINTTDNMLIFKNAPDFENPKDSDKNNIYIVEIIGTSDSNATAAQTITDIVTNDTADDGPKFTSDANISILENRQLNFNVKADGAVKYNIDGDDKMRFDLNKTTGKLLFLNFLPDFEASSDKNHDNNYSIAILATDDQNYSSTQNMIIEIKNDPSDDQTDSNRIKIYKTGDKNDGIVEGQSFGDDRNFTLDIVGSDRIIKIGDRIWQDSPDNKKADYTFEEAQNYCDDLNYGEISDWRVPNRHELYEIVNYGYANTQKPTIDDIFENALKTNYWTSQNVVDYGNNILTNEAFAVYFVNGASYSLKRDQKFAVRCVSGKKLEFNEIVTKDGDDIYRDEKTALEWTSPLEHQTLLDAKKRCENLKFGGFDDWRLPNINELHTIMPTYGENFLLDETRSGPFWATTKLDDTHGRYIENYWNINWDLATGRDVLNDDSEKIDAENTAGSICVRGGHF